MYPRCVRELNGYFNLFTETAMERTLVLSNDDSGMFELFIGKMKSFQLFLKLLLIRGFKKLLLITSVYIVYFS